MIFFWFTFLFGTLFGFAVCLNFLVPEVPTFKPAVATDFPGSTFIFLRRVLTFPPNPRNVRRCSRTASFSCSLTAWRLSAASGNLHSTRCLPNGYTQCLSNDTSLNPEAIFWLFSIPISSHNCQRSGAQLSFGSVIWRVFCIFLSVWICPHFIFNGWKKRTLRGWVRCQLFLGKKKNRMFLVSHAAMMSAFKCDERLSPISSLRPWTRQQSGSGP